MGGDSSGQTLERVLRRAGLVDATGRPLVSFHGLRHTAASVMLARGVPLLVVSRQLGHRNPNVTAEVYAHLLHDAQLDEAMGAFSQRPHGAGDGGEPPPARGPASKVASRRVQHQLRPSIRGEPEGRSDARRAGSTISKRQ
jgi:hypothetical protein